MSSSWAKGGALAVLGVLAMVLTACGPLPTRGGAQGPGAADGKPLRVLDPNAIADAVPRWEPYSKSGNRPQYVVLGRSYQVLPSGDGYQQRGVASWYGTLFDGRSTANGERYDVYAMTAAHKSLPLPTYAEVINLDNGRRAVVRINDRGPFHDDRLIDLSYAAAVKLGFANSGTAPVEVRAITTNPAVLARQPDLSDRRRQAMLPAESANGVYLQLGLFGDPGNMQRMLDRLVEARVENVLVGQESNASGALLYRLRIGPLGSRSQAEALAGRLNTIGIQQAFIVE